MRITWTDTVKGIAILWIVFFHGFTEYRIGRYPWALDDGFWRTLCGDATGAFPLAACAIEAAVVAVSSVGFHCVGVFILLSGFTLGVSAARRVGRVDWLAWYRSRLLRLFPLYWTAHLLYLISPPQVHLEAVDYRFLLSLLGDRVFPLNELFFYANAAWWYFGLLLQLYLVFPILFETLRRSGPLWFLALAAIISVSTRYVFLFPWASEYSEPLLLGAAFTSRLLEFCAGIVLATTFVGSPTATTLRLRSPWTAVAGATLYVAGLYSYRSQLAYVATDALIGCGLSTLLIVLAHWLERFPAWRNPLAFVGKYSYGLYLFHQPYMTWLGTNLRWASLPMFVAADAGVTAALAGLSLVIEKRVNAVVARWTGGQAP